MDTLKKWLNLHLMHSYFMGLKTHFMSNGGLKKMTVQTHNGEKLPIYYYYLADYRPILADEAQYSVFLPDQKMKLKNAKTQKGDAMITASQNTEDSFDQAAASLSERLNMDISDELAELRESTLSEPQSCSGVICCMEAIHSGELFHQFMELLPILNQMAVPVRINEGIAPFAEAELSFWDIMEVNPLPLIQKYIGQTHMIRPLLNSPQKLSDLYASAIMDVSINLYAEEPSETRYALVHTRFENTVNFLLGAVSVDLEGYDIRVSGSDPHMLGRQVLFAERNSSQWAYKPRNMKADYLFTGPNSFITYLNERLPDECHLPCMVIFDNANYGMEELVTKKPDFTETELHSYYKKMGVLAYAAKLAGVTDLHQDNIMPTENGPIVLDAECAFQINVITSASLNATMIRDSLCSRQNAFGDDAVSYFTFDGKDGTCYDNVQFFYPDFTNGFFTASQYCMEHIEELSDFLTSLIRQNPLLRLVPVRTSELARALSIYVDYEDKDRIADDYCNLIQENLKTTFFIQNIQENVLKEALHHSFQQGDIPLIQLDLSTGNLSNVLINGMAFAQTDLYQETGAISEIFKNTIHYLAEFSADELIETFLPVNE